MFIARPTRSEVRKLRIPNLIQHRLKNWPVPPARVERLESRQLLSAPVLPSIPSGAGHLFVITAAPYNAVGDGTTDDTTAIQNAVNDCANATTDNGVTKGGTVEVPTGTFEFKHLNMASNVLLQLDSGAILQAFGQSVIGTTNNNLIYCNNISNFEVLGVGSGASQGRIDGNGGTWYPNNNGPYMFTLTNTTKVLFQNVSLTNSPLYHIECGGQNNNVTMNNVTINTPSTSHNTDGIDPKGNDWLIENCTISDGDDNIALKPGSTGCNNISIQNCTLLFGHGISIGSDTVGGVNNFTVNNVTFNGTSNGLRMKANRGGGGPVNNVTYSNITMTGVQYPILIDDYYNQSNNFPTNPGSDTAQPINATSNTPTWTNITFMNITSTDTATNSVCAAIYPVPEAPVTNMKFENVQITAAVGLEINHARGVTFDSNTHFTALHGPDLLGAYTYNSTSNIYTFTFPTPIDAQITEQGFTNQDIGSPTVPFDTSASIYDPDTGNWTIQGDGAGVAGSSDQFSYTNTPVTSDTAFSAKLTGLASAGSAGVMYRATTAAGDPFAAAIQNSTGHITFEYRTTSGGAIQTSGSVAGTVGSDYLKIARSGNWFIAYYSTDGSTWIQVGNSASISTIPAASSVGFAATSNSNGSLAQATFSSVQIGANVAPPEVTSVVVSGSAWAASYLSYLAGLNAANVGGYAIPAGANQTATLPWTNLDTIKITFSQNVSVSQASLQLFGVTQSNYTTNSFSYNSGSDTATWTIATPPTGPEKLLIDLVSSTITNSSSLALDGEWTDSTSAYPSGNGAAGGNFLFSFNILPGDIDQSGGVNIFDTISVRNAQGSTPSTPATYNVLMDVDGGGGINIVDTIAVRNRQGTTLPAGTPSASVVSAGPIVSATSLDVTTNSTDQSASISSVLNDRRTRRFR